MSSLPPDVSAPAPLDLVIIGGGLAGLAAARVAAERGLRYLVVEAADRLGGRVATDEVDGFLIDRGFQVLLTSYPELDRLGVLPELALGRFEPGAYVRLAAANGRGAPRFRAAPDPWRRPGAALGLGWRHVFGLGDALRLARFRAGLRREDPAARGRSTFEYLEHRGFSRDTIQRFFVPFLGGVFLDRTLSAPATFMRRLFAAFATGDAAIPGQGMQALPAALARPLDPRRLLTGTAVAALSPGAVRLTSGETLAAERVLVATDGDAAARLLATLPGASATPAPTPPSWHRTTSFYYTSAGPLPAPLDRPSLVLDGEGVGPIHHLAPLSSVAPGLAPAGQSLVVASHDGRADASLEPAVTAELGRWFPGTAWRLVAVRPIERGLPAMATEPPEPFRAIAPWLAVAGDHTWDRSIDGALFAGKCAAEHLCSRA